MAPLPEQTLPSLSSSPSTLKRTLPDALAGRGPSGSGYSSRSNLRAASFRSGVSAVIVSSLSPHGLSNSGFTPAHLTVTNSSRPFRTVGLRTLFGRRSEPVVGQTLEMNIIENSRV